MTDKSKQIILVVDDQPENIDIIRSVFADHLIVKIATNGQSALKAVAVKPIPDLILLDIMMPGMDGYEVCRRLKADPLTAFIPVVFLTSRDLIMDEAKGLMLGAVDFILKPIDTVILEMRVRSHLRHHSFWIQREESLRAHINQLERQIGK